MKKMNVIILVVAALSCFVACGRPVLSLNNVAVVKTGEGIKVIYQGASQAPVNLALLDAEGDEVFHEKIVSTHGFIRPYNFSGLTKGNYQLHVADPNGEYWEEVYFEGEWKTRHAEVKPYNGLVSKLTGSENKYLVAVPCRFLKEFAVQVYDRNEELIFSESQKIEHDFAKVYNLKNLEGATIKLEPQSSNQTISEGVKRE